jgi:hypothetical protein
MALPADEKWRFGTAFFVVFDAKLPRFNCKQAGGGQDENSQALTFLHTRVTLRPLTHAFGFRVPAANALDGPSYFLLVSFSP